MKKLNYLIKSGANFNLIKSYLIHSLKSHFNKKKRKDFIQNYKNVIKQKKITDDYFSRNTFDWIEVLEDYKDKSDVKQFVKECLQCSRNRSEALEVAPWGMQVHAKEPGDVLHLDFLSVDVRDGQKYKYILVLKDDLSHLVELVPTQRATASNVVNACIRWCSRLRIPKVIVTDQGAHFKNMLMQELCTAMRIQHKLTFPYSPWSNGTVERVNREVIKLLRTFCSEFKVRTERWVVILPLIQYALNSTAYESLGNMSPSQVANP